MKILAIHNFYKIRSGEDLAFDATVASLRESGHEVIPLTRDNSWIMGWRMALVPFSSLFSLSAFLSVWKEADRHRPDVAMVQNVFPLLSPSVYLALRLKGVPVAQRIFNYRLICANGVLFTENEICERCSKGSSWNAVARKCYRGSAVQSAVLAFSLWFWRTIGVWRWGVRRFLTPDQFLGTKILPVVRDERKITIVFNPEPIGSSEIPTEQPQRQKEILFVGRWVREKGILTFIRTAALLPQIQFSLIGKGEQEEEARSLGRLLGLRNLNWVGPLYGDALRKRMDMAGALMVPSEWYDNMPLILTQALLRGTPIVASRINGIPEFIIDGETGRLANPKDPSSFARSIEDLFANPKKTSEMAEEGRKRGLEWFSASRFSSSLEKVFEGMKR